MKKKCLICGVILHGRVDKKFCSDNCRNKYHNSLNPDASKYIRRVNYVLRKNRRILLELNRKGIENISKTFLAQTGFDFNFLTSKYQNKNGEICLFCYEIGYKENHDGLFSVVEKKDLKMPIYSFYE
jgi:hypothetical protein